VLIVRTAGGAFDRGRQHGLACAVLARPWFERLLADEHDRISECDLRAAVNRLRTRLERVYPDGYLECRGIASGLGMPDDDYFAGIFSCQLLSKLTACTAFGFRGSNGEAQFCKSDDVFLEDLPLNVMEVTSPDDGYGHVHFHFAGTIWTIAGMNERGLAMGMTAIPGPLLDEDGLFSLDALHTILPRCADVTELESHLRQLAVTYYGFSLMAADAKGGLALFEKTHAGLVRLPARDGGFFLHTNHILDPDFADLNPEQYEPVKSNGERRFANGLKLGRSLPRSVAGLEQFMSDRSPEGPICQQGENGMYSSLRILFDPSRMNMRVWSGCDSDAKPKDMAVDRLLGQD
jgi:hypothetical protein